MKKKAKRRQRRAATTFNRQSAETKCYAGAHCDVFSPFSLNEITEDVPSAALSEEKERSKAPNAREKNKKCEDDSFDKESRRCFSILNLTFCSSACSAVSIGLPAADAPAGGPADAPAAVGGPAPGGGCCIAGTKEAQAEAAASDKPCSSGSSGCFFPSLLLPLAWPAKSVGARPLQKGPLSGERAR